MIDMHLGCKPFFDRILTRLVDQNDCMYLHNDFVKPGRHSYFIFIPDGAGGFYHKSHYSTFVKPRKEDLVPRPIMRALASNSGPKKPKSRFASIMNAEWKFYTENTLEIQMLSDLE
jgi:hypothetical protein